MVDARSIPVICSCGKRYGSVAGWMAHTRNHLGHTFEYPPESKEMMRGLYKEMLQLDKAFKKSEKEKENKKLG